MKTCITHIANDEILVVRKSFEAITGSRSAGILLSYLVYWHDIKLAQNVKNKRMNEVAVQHGEEGEQDVSQLQYHSLEEVRVQCMGLLSQKATVLARKVLVEKGFVTEHLNPQKKYRFDKTIFYQVHPKMINKALLLHEECPTRQNDDIDVVEMTISKQSKRESGNVKMTTPITETTTETIEEEKINTKKNGEELESADVVRLSIDERTKLSNLIGSELFERYLVELRKIAIEQPKKFKSIKSHNLTLRSWYRHRWLFSDVLSKEDLKIKTECEILQKHYLSKVGTINYLDRFNEAVISALKNYSCADLKISIDNYGKTIQEDGTATKYISKGENFFGKGKFKGFTQEYFQAAANIRKQQGTNGAYRESGKKALF